MQNAISFHSFIARMTTTLAARGLEELFFQFLKRRKIGRINDLGLQLLSPAEESDSWHQ
jgi:hypothetical protein